MHPITGGLDHFRSEQEARDYVICNVCIERWIGCCRHKEALEKHLVKRLGELFKLDYDLLLYDVSGTYFEGVADPAIAKRGYSRDHRPDCVQVSRDWTI